MLSSIWTGYLLKGKAEPVSATETDCEDCGMGCAIETTVELGAKVEIDQLLTRQECHYSLVLAGCCRRFHGQKRSQSSRCCVKRQNCSWSGAERDRFRLVVGRQTRGYQLQKVLLARQDTVLKKPARGCETGRVFSKASLNECWIQNLESTRRLQPSKRHRMASSVILYRRARPACEYVAEYTEVWHSRI